MKRSWALLAACACAVAIAFLPGFVDDAVAATFLVTTTADTNDGACTLALCSLRDAVIASNANPGGNTITLPAGHYTIAIPGTGELAAATGDFNITQPVTISGAGAATTVVDGGSLDRVFRVASSAVIFNGITITGGRPGLGEDGGGILNDGTLTLNNCVVSANQTFGGGSGGGIWTNNDLTLNNTQVIVNNASGGGNGGGIDNEDVVRITSSSVSGNTAGAAGGNGGGLYNNGSATITDTTIALNNGAGGGNGAGVYNNGNALTVNRSTLSQNSTDGNGGGLFNNGIGVALTNVTISTNTAAAGGGLSNFGNGVDIIASTIASNNGGGIQNGGVGLNVTSTIIANNNGGNCTGSIGDGGTNMQFPGSTCGASITSANPLLAPLAGNGGPTQTHALAPGSPAIDTGTEICPPTPPTDQRGVPRPQGPACDIGAFEVQVAALPTLSINNVTANEGNSGNTPFVFTVTLSAASASTVTVNYATANGTATAGSDYFATSGTLTFAPGALTQTITVNVIGDPTAEPNETFFVNLSGPTNATIAVAQGTGTIVNDDAGSLPALSINSVAQSEGNGGTTPFVFTVTLSAASASTVTVNYATADGTATAGSDYIAASGTLTFAPGAVTQTVAISVVGDTSPEPNETFFVNLSSPTNATIAAATGTGTIIDDDRGVVTPTQIPTLSEWALTALAALVIASGLMRLRKRS